MDAPLDAESGLVMPGEVTEGAKGKHLQQYGVATRETFTNLCSYSVAMCGLCGLWCTVMLSSVGIR